MSKRFTDSDKYKKQFMRGLPAPYKLFWDYILCECDYAGVWIVDMDIASVYLGSDINVDAKEALRLFNLDQKRVYVFDNGKKWFILDFIKFQYGELHRNNLAHRSVIKKIEEYGLQAFITSKEKPSPKGKSSPCKGATPGACKAPKDKEKDKDKEKEKEKDKDNNGEKQKTIQEEVIELYHQLCPSLPKVTVLNEPRKKSIPVRVKEIGGIEKVRELLERTEKSDFLTGRKTDWKATFDWLFCCKSNWIKVAEGQYDNGYARNSLQTGQIFNDEQSDDILKKAGF